MFSFVDGLITSFSQRLTYSVENMTIPQWGILTVVALVMGFMLLKSRR